MIYIKRLFARFGKEKQLSTLSAQSGKQDNRGAVLNQIFFVQDVKNWYMPVEYP